MRKPVSAVRTAPVNISARLNRSLRIGSMISGVIFWTYSGRFLYDKGVLFALPFIECSLGIVQFLIKLVICSC
jgi:hypothetical protein